MTTQVSELIQASALRDFRDARRKAALQDIIARLKRKSDDLISYEDARRLLRAEGATQQGLQDIPLDAIVGSVGRYADFTRSFLPRRDSDRERWAKVKLKAMYLGGLPPIEVYRIGEAYFVLDGNHRVSVARELGASHIQAYVTEVHTMVPLDADVKPDDLIIKARHAEFLEDTQLHQLRPQADFTMTAPGSYRLLEEQIKQHEQHLRQKQAGDVSREQAAVSWCDHVYLPVVKAIRHQGILRDFPGRTEADLYVWVSRHQEEVGKDKIISGEFV